MNRKFRASFTIEITYILFFVFCGIAFIIGYAIDRHTEVVNNAELNLLTECIGHDEEGMGYEKEVIKEKAAENIKVEKSINIIENAFFVKGEVGENSIETGIFNPEAYLRATTALEGIYERHKGKLSEEPEE